jgi:hypothetical protein
MDRFRSLAVAFYLTILALPTWGASIAVAFAGRGEQICDPDPRRSVSRAGELQLSRAL